MRAVGAGTADKFDVSIKQERRARVLDRRRESLDARDHPALIRQPEPDQNGRDVGGGKQTWKACHQCGGIIHTGSC